MQARFVVPVAVLALWAGAAMADTLYLKNGVRVHGVVTERPDGIYKVQSGRNTVVYRPSEVERIERNDRDGSLDMEELRARWAEHDARMTERTGLTADQRRRVKDLMYQLQTDDEAKRHAVREKLIAMSEEMDVFGYLAYRFPEVSDRLSPYVLEAMFAVNPGQARAHVRDGATHVYYGTRAMAIELLARMRDAESEELILRGLADHSPEVVIAALYSLAQLGAKRSTPVMIELLAYPDLRVTNAARESLQALWRQELGDAPPGKVSEWTAFWQQQDGSSELKLAGLAPLIPEEWEFQDE